MSIYTTARSGNFPILSLFNPSPNSKDLHVKEISYTRHTPHEAYPHSCKGFCIHFILSGKLKISGRILDKSYAYMHSNNTDYSPSCVDDNPREEVIINFSGASALSLIKKLNLDATFSIFPNPYNEKIGEIIKEAIHSDYSNKDIDYSLLAILYSTLSYIQHNKVKLLSPIIYPSMSHSEYSNDYIQKACSFIENHYFEHLTVSDIAEYVNVSTGYLCRLFKQILGKNPQEYIKKYRIRIAENLLIETTMSISSIATSVGYPDTQHFSQVFRSVTNHTPSQYRKIIERDRQNDIQKTK